MTMKLVLHPDPLLKQVCVPIQTVGKDILTLATEMAETMRAYDGVAIAAPQVGCRVRMVVISKEEAGTAGVDGDLVMIDPILTTPVADATLREAEGCLSYPGVQVAISRYSTISVAYVSPDQQNHVLVAEGHLARVIQHEVDHLDGKTILDHAGPVRRSMSLKKLGKLKRPFLPKVAIYQGKEKGICQDCVHFSKKQVETIGTCAGHGHDAYGLPVGDLVASAHGCTKWEQNLAPARD